MRVFTEQESIKVQASTYEMVREWEDVWTYLKSDGIIYLLHSFPSPNFHFIAIKSCLYYIEYLFIKMSV